MAFQTDILRRRGGGGAGGGGSNRGLPSVVGLHLLGLLLLGHRHDQDFNSSNPNYLSTYLKIAH